MDHQQLIQMLRCPETMQTVREASASELAEWNCQIALGLMKTRVGNFRKVPLTAALVREDGHLVFPVENDIPIMLLEEALVVT